MAKTPQPVEPSIAPGTIFLGKYRVDRILGQGGMGIVAACTHLALDERVAIKMLRADVLLDRDAVERFMREAQAAVKLRSEYVARVSDVGTTATGAPYMVMEYLDGHDLGELLEQRGCLPYPWATELMLQAAEGLCEAHSIGIVHRDVKPTNLFVTWRPDGSALIKVLDFGISKAPMGSDMQLTQTQSLLGTPAYMSPEQMRSARMVDGRTDIWSLGTVMYELLEGRRPFEAESFSEMCVKVAVDAPAPMVNTPPPLQQVVMRCLAKSPEQRYATMAELGRDLVPFAQDPQQAQMLVDRMTRMIGRRAAAAAGTDWDQASSTNGGTRSQPGLEQIRELKSGPVYVPRTTPPPGAVQPLARPHDGSVPTTAPMRTELVTKPPRRKPWGILLGFAVALSVATGYIVVTSAGADDPPAPVAAPVPPAPPVTSAGSAVEVPKVDPAIAEAAAAAAEKAAAEKAAAEQAAAEQAAAAQAATKPPKRPPTTGRPPRPAKPPVEKVTPPPESVNVPPKRVDPFATPRPSQKR